jgi:hypothetical protein
LIKTLGDMAILKPDEVRTAFFGAAAFLDGAATVADDAQEQTLAASRVWLEETAAGFRIAIPPKGKVELPRRS